MKTIKLITLFCFWLPALGFSQPPLDFRDNFTGLYHVYNMWPYHDIMVIRDSSTVDSLYIFDEMWSEGPYPDCPVNCYRHQVKLNSDSTWYDEVNYNGHFKKTDTIHLLFVAPGPFAYIYDAEKISPIGLYNLNKKDQEWYLFPNPASNELTIVLPGLKEEVGIRLLDINGKLVLEKQFTSGTQLHVGDLPRGVYIVRIQGKDINLSKRVVLVE